MKENKDISSRGGLSPLKEKLGGNKKKAIKEECWNIEKEEHSK